MAHFGRNIQSDNTTIFTNDGQNALGQVKAYTLGNGKTSANIYYHGIPTQYLTAGVQNLTMNWNYLTGNLNRRSDNAKGRYEDFTYDNLDRLTSTKVDNQSIVNMGFAPSGNITSKTDVGTYTYDGTKKHTVTEVTNTATTIPTFQQDIVFTSYERPERITENGNVLTYTYGADYERIKGVMVQSGTTLYTRYFLGDYEKTIQGGNTQEVHYISSPAGLISMVVRTNGGTFDYKYVYTDHLGSILTVTNSSGAVEAEQSFDAWGRRKNVTTWVPNAPTATTGLPNWLYRGYTGHEHLDQFGIINMNARLYDPVLGRMISPDDLISGVFKTQGYNRYSYANNNPLKYTDPSGHFAFLVPALGIFWAAVVEGAVLSAVVNIAFQAIQNGGFNNFNWGSFGLSFVQGAIGAGFGQAIGGAFAGLSGGGWLDIAKIGVHGISGGLQSAIFGGDFGQGAISGVIGSAFGQAFANADGINLVGSFIVGGTPAAVTALVFGGDPFQAFVTGGTVAGFNHFLHSFSFGPGKGKKVPKYQLESEPKSEPKPEPKGDVMKKPSIQDLKKNPPSHPDYEAPKGGDRRVNHPRGNGWVDKDGRVWIPDDHNGTHAPHWDVQPEKGPGYQTVYPILTPRNIGYGVGAVGASYIIYKIIVGLATWECGGCGVLITP